MSGVLEKVSGKLNFGSLVPPCGSPQDSRVAVVRVFVGLVFKAVVGLDTMFTTTLCCVRVGRCLSKTVVAHIQGDFTARQPYVSNGLLPAVLSTWSGHFHGTCSARTLSSAGLSNN